MFKISSIKFIIVGILNTIVGYTCFFALYKFFGLNHINSLVISHIVGVIHSYIWNSKWTFGYSGSNLSSVLKFISIYTITFFLNLALLFILVDILHKPTLLSQAISMFLVTMVSYIGQKFWSFKEN